MNYLLISVATSTVIIHRNCEKSIIFNILIISNITFEKNKNWYRLLPVSGISLNRR